MTAPQNFFEQFSDPAQTALRNKPIAEASRDAAEEARKAAEERRKEIEFASKFNPDGTPKDVAGEIPGDPSKTGEEYLATLPPGMAASVRAIAEGRRALPTRAGMRSPQMIALANAAMQYDPSLDEANAATRVATRKSFTSGKDRQNLTAINTAIGHIASLKQTMRDLNNTNFPWWNALSNKAHVALGDASLAAKLRQFKIQSDAVATELSKVFAGKAPGVTEIREWRENLNDADSPAAMEAAINGALDLMHSRLASVGDAYNAGMSRSDEPMMLLSPHAQEQLKELESGVASSGQETRGDLLGPAPEGMELSGGGVKGYRYTPEQEAQLRTELGAPQPDQNAVLDHMVQFAIQNGAIKPEQADSFRQSTAEKLGEFLNQFPKPEQRTGTVFDYGDVDKEATKNAGLITSLTTAAGNIPTSAASFAGGVAALPASAVVSLLQGKRFGAFKTFTDLASELAGAATGSPADTPTVNAFTEALKQRYGSWDAFKQSAIKDPVGVAGDLSAVFTGGGGAVAKVGRMAGSAGLEAAGEAASRVGAAIDPITGMRNLPDMASKVGSKIPQGARDLALEAPTELLAMPSGVGGASLREGAAAGFERGQAGAPTPRSEAFTQSMRDPGSTADDMVAQARDAVQRIRDAASQRYQARMAQFGRNPTPLDISVVQQRIARLKPRNYDAMVNAPKRPADHVAWEQLRDTVNHYADQAQADPSLLEPLQMDAFKQDLYDVGSRLGGAYDRTAARMAGQAYDAVRSELVKHDPVYADTMADYERAAREAQQLEGTFGLAAARGKPVNVDSAARRLQSILRNNANTNYGRRAAQGARLNDLGDGTLMASLAGQSASSLTPRGIRVAASPAEIGAAYGAAGLAGAAPAAIISSPRAMGELAYGAGRAAGTVARGASKFFGPGAPARLTAEKLLELQGKYPGLTNAAAVADNALDNTEEQLLRDRYGFTMPVLKARGGRIDKAKLAAKYGAK